MKTNAELRKQARHLYWSNRGLLWIVYALLIVSNLIWSLLHHYWIHNTILVFILDLILHWMITPFMLFGTYMAQLTIWHGKTVSFIHFFDFYRPPYQFSSVCFAVLASSYLYLLSLFNIFVQSYSPFTQVWAIVTAAIYLCVLVLYFWLLLRMFLFPFLFINDPDRSIWMQIKSSFKLMKGKGKRLFWYGVTIYLPIIIIYIAIIWLELQYAVKSSGAIDAYLVSMLLFSMVNIIFLPGIDMALVGYADKLLKSDEIKGVINV